MKAQKEFAHGRNQSHIIVLMIFILLFSSVSKIISATTAEPSQKESWKDNAVKIFLDISYRYKKHAEYIQKLQQTNA